VEIKSTRPDCLSIAIKKANELSALLNVEVEVITFKQLKHLCISLNLNIYKLIDQWKTMSKFGSTYIGDTNPMFGHKHSIETKQQLSKLTTIRMQDKEQRLTISNSLKNYYANGGISVGPPKQRKILICKNCHKEFEVLKSSKQQYCSHKCALEVISQIAYQSTRDKRLQKHNLIKQEIFNYFYHNQELLYSKCRNNIYKQIYDILSKHNIKDIRVFKFMFTNDYRASFDKVLFNLILQFENYLKYMPNLQDDKL
jgi:hypothetical protein